MPWDAEGASRHNKRARTNPKANRAFQHAANQALRSGKSEGAAVRIGNYAASRAGRKNKRKGGRK